MKKYFIILLLLTLFSITKNAHDDINDPMFNEKYEDDIFKKIDFSNVVTYDDSNYVSRVKIDKPLLMYVYTPYDPDCQQTVEIFVKMADFIKNNKTDLTMAKVNAKENKDFVKEYKIEEVPKLLYIGRDRKVVEYKQEITSYNLLRFIKKKLYGNALEFEKLEEVNATVADPQYKKNQVFVLSTLAFEFKKEIFNNYADENDREIYIHCFSIECYNEYNEDIVIYKHFDEKIILYSDHFKSGADRLDVDKIRKFVMRYSVEAGGLLENEYFIVSKNYKRKMIIYFRDEKDENQTKYDKVIKEAGLEIRKKIGYTFVSDIKGNDFYKKIAEKFVIDKRELPTLLYVDKINLKDLKKCKTYRITNVDLSNLNKEYVFKFVKDVQKNRIYKDLKTQFLPEPSLSTYMNGTFKIVVGRTYDNEIIRNKKNVIITFVDKKNKCELCDTYLEVVKQYKESLGDKNNNFEFAVIDGANNDARGIQFIESDLPFIYFYTNKEKNKSKYMFKPEDKGEEISALLLEKFIKNSLNSNDVKGDL